MTTINAVDNGLSGATGTGSFVGSNSPTFTGTVVIPTPFTLGATSVTSTGTNLNLLSGAAQTIVQVVSATFTSTTTVSSATFTDSGLTATITPLSSSNKIIVIVMLGVGGDGANQNFIVLVRGSTNIIVGDAAGSRIQTTQTNFNATAGGMDSVCVSYIDSPATTSSTTYKIQIARNTGAGSVYINRQGTDANNAGNSRTASSIILMEVTP